MIRRFHTWLAAWPLSHDVELPRDREPLFPERCVRCGLTKEELQADSGKQAIFWKPFRWYFWLIPLRDRKFPDRVPACSVCASAMDRQWLTRAVIELLLIVTGCWTIFTITPEMTKTIRMLGMAAGGLAAYLPYFFWEATHPVPFDVTASGNSVDYEFADKTYALQFAILNQAEVPESVLYDEPTT